MCRKSSLGPQGRKRSSPRAFAAGRTNQSASEGCVRPIHFGQNSSKSCAGAACIPIIVLPFAKQQGDSVTLPHPINVRVNQHCRSKSVFQWTLSGSPREPIADVLTPSAHQVAADAGKRPTPAVTFCFTLSCTLGKTVGAGVT